MGSRSFENSASSGTNNGAGDQPSAFHAQLFGAAATASSDAMPPLQQLSPEQLALVTFNLPSGDTSTILQQLSTSERGQYNSSLGGFVNPTEDQQVEALSQLPSTDLIKALQSVPQADLASAWSNIESQPATMNSPNPDLSEGQSKSWVPLGIGLGGAAAAAGGLWMLRDKLPGMGSFSTVKNHFPFKLTAMGKGGAEASLPEGESALLDAAKVIEEEPFK